MPNIVTLQISEAFYPRIYEGKSWSPDEPVKYGLSIKAEELPDALRPWASPSREHGGYNLIGMNSRLRPMVICSGRDVLRTTLQCSADANLRNDELFTGIPLELAVDKIEFESHGPRAPKNGEMVKMLAVVGVRVNGDDLIRRYDELCAQYFTGA